MGASLRIDPLGAAAAPVAAVPAGAPAQAAGQSWRVLAVLSALLAFASISTDFYLPALPTMAAALHSEPGTVAFTISGYLIGFSVGQLFWGPVGDRYGRRGPIAVGLVLFVIGSAGCALSGSAGAVIGWRVVQALGACASVVLGRAMVRDLFSGNRAAQVMSTLMLVMAIAPLLGPVLGGQILAFAGWRAIFWVLVGVGVLTFASLWTLPDTLPPCRRSTEPLRTAFARYGQLVRQRRLLGFAGIGGCFFGGTFAYIAGSPFAYITYHHLPAQYYGLLFGAGIVGLMALNLVNVRLVMRLGSETLLLAGNLLAALAGVAVAVDAWTGWGGIFGLAVPMFAFVSATGLISANAVAGALSEFPEQAGAVSALFGTIQYGTGILGSALVGAFSDGTPWPMGMVVGGFAVGGLVCGCGLRGVR
jgi:DHA1 family bicyclomycin/chloramphenicol resistance-like MFS transporter